MGWYDFFVNYRHLSCLVDVMTVQGGLAPMGGKTRDSCGPLFRAPWADPMDTLQEAAFIQEKQNDLPEGFTETLMLGDLFALGRGRLMCVWTKPNFVAILAYNTIQC